MPTRIRPNVDGAGSISQDQHTYAAHAAISRPSTSDLCAIRAVGVTISVCRTPNRNRGQ